MAARGMRTCVRTMPQVATFTFSSGCGLSAALEIHVRFEWLQDGAVMPWLYGISRTSARQLTTMMIGGLGVRLLLTSNLP